MGLLHDLIWAGYTPGEVPQPPTGTKSITANGTGIDIAGYAKADVNVPNPSTGTLQITANGEGINVTQYAAVDVNVPNPSTGTLQITQNGEGINVTQYAAVDVNVSSPFSTAQVTINPVNSRTLTLPIPGVFSSGGFSAILVDIILGGGSAGTWTVPLYNGVCVITVETLEYVNVSGACEYDDGQLIISGDCSITITETAPNE